MSRDLRQIARTIFDKVRRKMPEADQHSAGLITGKIAKAMVPFVRKRPAILEALITMALGNAVRDWIKHQPAPPFDDHPVSAADSGRGTVLELVPSQPLLPWPEALEPFVQSVGVVAIFVPSLRRHVPLSYGISVMHLLESKFYYATLAVQTQNRSKSIDDLIREIMAFESAKASRSA